MDRINKKARLEPRTLVRGVTTDRLLYRSGETGTSGRGNWGVGRLKAATPHPSWKGRSALGARQAVLEGRDGYAAPAFRNACR